MPRSIVQSKIFSPLAQSKPVAVRAGEFLFLSGQTPHDPETGKLVMNLQDVKDRAKGVLDVDEYGSLFDRVILAPMAAQAFTILANIKDILSENGLSLEHIVKTNVYITNFQELPVFHRIWRKFFPKPTTACSVAGISTVGMNSKIRLIVDCIAALPEKIPVSRIQRFPSENPQVGFGGCAAVKAGDLIFISGHIGVDNEGIAILKCKDVSKEAQRFIENMGMATMRTEATVAQAWCINKHISDLLEKIGSTMDNVLIRNTFGRTMYHDRCYTHPVNKIFHPKAPPAGTGFGYPSIFGNENLYSQVEGIATFPGKKEVLNFGPQLAKPATHYSMATKAGQYIFLSGRAGINWQRNGDPVISSGDLTAWNGQHITVGLLEEERPVFLQAWYIYEAINKIVKEMGGTLDDIVKTNVYLTDVADFPLVERARNYFFKNDLPAFTIIPVSEVTMHRELVAEVEPIIVMD